MNTATIKVTVKLINITVKNLDKNQCLLSTGYESRILETPRSSSPPTIIEVIKIIKMEIISPEAESWEVKASTYSDYCVGTTSYIDTCRSNNILHADLRRRNPFNKDRECEGMQI